MKRFIVGIDEVGRGPLAGPVTVAAVVCPHHKLFRGIKDSKKLSEQQRENWEKILRVHEHEGKIAVAISSVGAAFIDRWGMVVAARVAVGRCLKKIKNQNVKIKNTNQTPKILLDGSLFAPRTYQNQQTIIKGDEKIPIIAAASIVAKVYRDRTMRRLRKKYPEYGFDMHKGYGTKIHQQAIRTHGLCTIHRKSFCRKLLYL